MKSKEQFNMTDESVNNIIASLTDVFQVGKSYFIRATFAHTGRVAAVKGFMIGLEDSAWIADTSRFADFLSGKSEADEVEPCPSGMRVWINVYDITDAYEWPHPLPRKQK